MKRIGNLTLAAARSAIVSIVLIGTMAGRLHAVTLTVTSTNDSGPGSLRATLASASDGDTIDASAVTGTVTLTTGELLVTNSVIILGSGPNQLAVNGNACSRVFNIGPGNTIMISSLTITNGCCYDPNYGGGGMLNHSSTLTLSNCTVTGNSIAGNGGGICNSPDYWGDAALLMANCSVSGNSATYSGGGIFSAGNSYFGRTAYLQILNCTINANMAGTCGGGVLNSGPEGAYSTLVMIFSTISGNSATDSGGGIVNGAGGQGDATVMAISNCTFSSNYAATNGGGIYTFSGGTIRNCTFSGNSANGTGGAVQSEVRSEDVQTLEIANCTFSGDLASNGGTEIFNSQGLWIGGSILDPAADGISITNVDLMREGTLTSGGYNLCRDDGGGYLTATGDQINTDPLLGPLATNGGPTLTHRLLCGSPAIDAGDPAFSPPPEYDQRGPGYSRVIGGRIDIGAVEFNPAATVCDGVSELWRAQYFGGDGTTTDSLSCAICDADGTGQNNLFKYTAGLDPTNPASVFVLKIASVSGQPTQKNLLFKPWASGRTYTTQFTTNLVGTAYATLPGIGGPTTNANEVTVTDLNAVEQQKFYRIKISFP
jgi:predicted outer membrane repeat protein